MPRLTATIAAMLVAAGLGAGGWPGVRAEAPAPAPGAAPGPAAADAAGDCALTPAELYREAAPGVVRIVGVGIDPMRATDRVHFNTGTGIVLGDGLVLTNLHVIADAKEIVAIHRDNAWPVEVIGRDAVLDLAILRAPALVFTTLPLPLSPADPVPGDPAFVVGYPLGLGQSITSGIVSGIDRFLPLNTSSWLTRYIQTDAPVSPGNSGGPLLDRCGRVMGIVTLKSLTPEAEGIGYALPVSEFGKVRAELVGQGRVRRPWHGLYGQMVSPLILNLMGRSPREPAGGFLVETVEPGSAADRAGLRGGTLPVLWGALEVILGGDVITEVNGHSLGSLEDAIAAVEGLVIGASVSLRYQRGGLTREATVTIEERPVFESDLVSP